MTAILTEILGDVAALESDGLKQYEALARSIQAGEKTSAADVLAILRAAGKTTTDLTTLVDILNHRAKLRAAIAEESQLSERAAELRQQVEAANAELQKHVDAHQAQCFPLQSELGRIRDRRDAIGLPHMELMRTCPSEELKQKQVANRRQLQSAQQAVTAASDNLNRMKAHRHSHNYLHFEDTRPETESAIKRCEERLQAAQLQAAELENEATRINEAMRDW